MELSPWSLGDLKETAEKRDHLWTGLYEVFALFSCLDHGNSDGGSVWPVYVI